MLKFISDNYLFLIIVPLLLSIAARFAIKTTYLKYSAVFPQNRVTGAELARRILDQNGLQYVNVTYVSGQLTDHYNPATQTVSLSESNYNSASVAALGVAAHEVGHAIQHATEFGPIKLKSAMVVPTRIASSLYLPLVVVGLYSGFSALITWGIVLFAAIVLFEVITLPVELNASERAIKTLELDNILIGEELEGAKKVPVAAAFTYVASIVTSITQLIRLILISKNGRRR